MEQNNEKIDKLESSLPAILQQSLSPILIKLNDVESCVKQINAKQIKKDLENTKQELITKNEFTIQLAKKEEENVILVNKISEFESKLEKLRNDCESKLENTTQELNKVKTDFEITKNEFTKQLAKKDEEIVKLKEKQLLDYTVDNGIVYEWDSKNKRFIRSNRKVDALSPIGSVASLFSYIPEGWVKADGKILSGNEYRKLYEVIGNYFGGNWGKFYLPSFTESSPYGYMFIKAK